MSTFQRMIAIPQEEYLALSSLQNVREPFTQQFYQLEKRYKDEEKEKDPYRRMLLQGSTLDEMKQVKEALRNSLVSTTPKPYQNRAKALFQSLENVIKFNDKGEIYTDDGSLVSGSRLEDLIQHAVRDRRRNFSLKGWPEFLSLLRNHNIPKSTLNRYTLDEMEGMSTPKPVMKREASDSPPPPSTAQRRSRLPRLAKPSFDVKVKQKGKTDFLKTYKP